MSPSEAKHVPSPGAESTVDVEGGASALYNRQRENAERPTLVVPPANGVARCGWRPAQLSPPAPTRMPSLSATPARRLPTLLLALALVVSTAAAYAPVLDAGWVWDDDAFVT